MATDNTPEDIGFAKIYVEYMSRRAPTAEQRARAQVLLGLIAMLDQRFPTWRDVLLADLAERGETRSIPDLFELPTEAEDEVFKAFMDAVTKSKGK